MITITLVLAATALVLIIRLLISVSAPFYVGGILPGLFRAGLAIGRWLLLAAAFGYAGLIIYAAFGGLS